MSKSNYSGASEPEQYELPVQPTPRVLVQMDNGTHPLKPAGKLVNPAGYDERLKPTHRSNHCRQASEPVNLLSSSSISLPTISSSAERSSNGPLDQFKRPKPPLISLKPVSGLRVAKVSVTMRVDDTEIRFPHKNLRDFDADADHRFEISIRLTDHTGLEWNISDAISDICLEKSQSIYDGSVVVSAPWKKELENAGAF